MSETHVFISLITVLDHPSSAISGSNEAEKDLDKENHEDLLVSVRLDS